MNLDTLKQLAEAATPGPWVVDDANSNLVARDGEVYEYVCEVSPSSFSESTHGQEIEDADAAFIAACNPKVIIALLGVVRAAKGMSEAFGEPDGLAAVRLSFELRDALQALEDL